MTERVNILGVGVSAVNMEQALATIDTWVASRARNYVCVCPVHSIMECRRSEEVRRSFNEAGMALYVRAGFSRVAGDGPP